MYHHSISQHTDPQGLARSVVASSPCGFSSITVRRSANAPASASTCTRWQKRWPVRRPSDEITLFSSSWKDRPSPALASEMGPSVRVVDRQGPGSRRSHGPGIAWNGPPVEWFAGAHDVVHSQSPLLIPTRHAAQVVTIHDLDFLRNPEQASSRNSPGLSRARAVSCLARRRGDRVVTICRRRGGE